MFSIIKQISGSSLSIVFANGVVHLKFIKSELYNFHCPQFFYAYRPAEHVSYLDSLDIMFYIWCFSVLIFA